MMDAEMALPGGRKGFSRMAGVLIALLAVVVFAGCTPTVRFRTLPPSIRSVYMPMIENRTQQPGLEERFTVEAQKELLADGRLSLVSEREADAIVEVSLQNFDAEPAGMDSDEFATSKIYVVETAFEVFENIPGRPSIGGRRTFVTRHYFNADPRSTAFNGAPHEMEALARDFGKQLVLEILTGAYEDFTPSPEEQKKRNDQMVPRPDLGISL